MSPTGFGHASDGGPIASDGSPVDLFSSFPAEPDLISLLPLMPPAGTVLELGCGAGRLANPLAERGYLVTGVDSDSNMLSRVSSAVRTVRRDIIGCDLAQTFDVVLLPSFLANSAVPGEPKAFLEACQRHAKRGGRVLVQLTTFEWAESLTVGRIRTIGDFESVAIRASVVGSRIEAMFRYSRGTVSWEHSWDGRLFREAEWKLLSESAQLGSGWPPTPSGGWTLLVPQ